MSKLALVSVHSGSVAGLLELKKATEKIAKFCEIEKLSSVYRVRTADDKRMRFADRPSRSGEPSYVVVLQLKTQLDPEALQLRLQRINAGSGEEKKLNALNANLLFFEGVIMALPHLALPNPEFHMNPEELVPAAELMPRLIHPVLRVSLKELVLRLGAVEWGEFYSQGTTLLDFDASTENTKEKT